jgi:hypothetical protein
MNPLSNAHLVFDKDKTHDGEKTVSSTNFVGKTHYLPAEN